ncbi:related to C2H2 transcription factor [Fusarium proliferatum]|nr:related to C2H2 transcription factor [Fusarium proliferatum]
MSSCEPSASSTTTLQHACSLCPKRFKRRSHLVRHAATHNPARPFACRNCGSSFQRVDVLRRHELTCLPGDRPPSRKRACNFCTQQKKACTGEAPCSNCRRKSIECISSSLVEHKSDKNIQPVDPNAVFFNAFQSQDAHRPDTLGPPVSLGDARSLSDPGSSTLASDIFSFSHAGNYPWFDLFDTAGSLSEILSSTIQAPGTYSFDFLNIFTSKTGLIQSFDCGSHIDRLQVLSEFSRNEPEASGLQSPDNTATIDLSDSAVHQIQIIEEPLTLRTYEILLQMKSAFDSKPRHSCITQEWSSVMEQQCLEFFSPKRIRKYLALYWEIWHPNTNFIHRSTFDPMSCNMGLMAAMVLIGASVSPDPSDIDQAKQWYSSVEEIVFTDQEFFNDRRSANNTTSFTYNSSLSEIQTLQAAYLVCMYQNWEGTNASKRRIRRYRYSTLVSMARDIGISTARHCDYRHVTPHDFVWAEFVAREQLIRTFLWIFLLDHGFVIFNSLPPRMAIQEMHMHMAWPESVFQAPAADDCFQQMQKWLQRCSLSSITVYNAIRVFCKSEMTAYMAGQFADLGPLNLFAIVAGKNEPSRALLCTISFAAVYAVQLVCKWLLQERSHGSAELEIRVGDIHRADMWAATSQNRTGRGVLAGGQYVEESWLYASFD